MSETETTILLDIYERLGKIETKLEGLKDGHKSMGDDVDDLKDFKSKLAAYIWLGGSVASGVLFFLWKGIEYGLNHWLPR